MQDTVKLMLESDFGFSMEGYAKNRSILENTQYVSDEIRQLTGFTPEKVVVLSDGNNIYIEFANNLERLMEDAKVDFREAIGMVMESNRIAGNDANIIIDESCIDRIDLDSLTAIIGQDHIFRK